MKTRALIVALSAVALCVVVASCGNRTNKKTALTTDQLSQSVINYPIPTAYEVTDLINRSGAAYIIGVTNPVDKGESYLSVAKKAINVGVYGADLSYVTTYNMKQETMDYMKVLKKLVDELEVSSNINTSLARDVENNIDNKDSLINIVSQSFHDTYSFLVNNGKDDVSILVLAGTWIEGLYLASYVTITSQNPADMLQIIANQKSSLNTLQNLIAKNITNPEIAKLELLLQPVRDEYDDVEGKVSAAQALQIFNAIEKIRNEVVK